MRDQMNSIHVVPVITPVVVTDNTAQVGLIVDRQGFGSLTFAIVTGTLADADATFAVLVEDGDEADLSDNAAVSDDQLLGTEALASFSYGNDNVTRKIGYLGDKQYVRLTITPSGNSGNAPLSVLAVLGHPQISPTPNPPSA